MKRFLLILFTSLLFYSCANSPKTQSDLPSIDQFKEDLASINLNLWGRLSRYTYKDDQGFLPLTYDAYLKHMSELAGERPQRLLKDIKSTESKEFRATKNKFIICYKSEKLVYVLCDDASTVGIDHISRDKPLVSTEEVLKKILK